VKHRHRRSRGGHGTFGKTLLGSAIGGAAYGWIEKSFPTLPTVPLVGRAGTVAIAGYFVSKQGIGGQIVRDVTIAAAVIAGYQLGKTGHVSGDIPSQVRGIAAQV
jgi:hypothetical protein